MRLASLVADAPPRASLASRKAITVALRAQRAKRRTITVAMKVVFAAASVGLTAPKWNSTDLCILLLRFLFGVLSRLVMADDTARTGPENRMMAGDVPSHSTDRRTFQAARGIGRSCDSSVAARQASTADTNVTFIRLPPEVAIGLCLKTIARARKFNFFADASSSPALGRCVPQVPCKRAGPRHRPGRAS